MGCPIRRRLSLRSLSAGHTSLDEVVAPSVAEGMEEELYSATLASLQEEVPADLRAFAFAFSFA